MGRAQHPKEHSQNMGVLQSTVRCFFLYTRWYGEDSLIWLITASMIKSNLTGGGLDRYLAMLISVLK